MNLIDPQKAIPKRFSAAAASYDDHAEIQRVAAEKVLKLAIEYPSINVLEIGCGTGILTEMLANTMPKSFITAIDISGIMIKEAQRQLAGLENIKWTTSDIKNFNTQEPFHLITSNAAIHWITPISNAFEYTHRLLDDKGHLVLSIMLKDTLGELRESRNRVASYKPALKDLPTEEEVFSSLQKTGFNLLKSERKDSKIFYSSASDFLRKIHDQGLTSGAVSTSGSLLNRTELQRLIDDYDLNHSNSDKKGVFATYRTLYVVAEKSKK
ncbi:methyltransferase domain-containing protein [Verrucomicrobiota bacterium]